MQHSLAAYGCSGAHKRHCEPSIAGSTHLLQDGDLPLYLLHHAAAHQLLLVEHFDRHCLAALDVLAILDFGVRALCTQGTAELQAQIEGMHNSPPLVNPACLHSGAA